MIVTARIDAGWHPDYGDIIAGREYEVSGEYPPDLFAPAAPAATDTPTLKEKKK